MPDYQPPFRITDRVINAVAAISELLGQWSGAARSPLTPTLRRGNRIRTIQASLAIEYNTLSVEQVTAVLEGKRVLGLPREIQEVHNAFATYDQLERYDPCSLDDLLNAHRLLMHGLIDDAGALRSGGVGIYREQQLVHMAPPANQLHRLMTSLLHWLQHTDAHPLVASCVFHYEFEFIHPFSDGNGRMGRLWQTLILARWRPVMSYVPVETVIHQQQDLYYEALAQADRTSDATPFLEFMLQALHTALLTLHHDTNSDLVGDPVSDQVERLLRSLVPAKGKANKELTSEALMQALGLKHKPTFRKNYLSPAMAKGWVAMTDPDSPNSPQQRYRLTEAGLRWTESRKSRR